MGKSKRERNMKKDAVVIHSGGMDSSICLALAIHEFGRENVLSLSFSYGQRHSNELVQAEKICHAWSVDHASVDLSCLQEITENALMNEGIEITHREGLAPNTLVVGRNGLMAHVGAIHAQHIGAQCIYMGIMSAEGANSGYRDCSREYIDLKQAALRIDFDDLLFQIRTPLVDLNKAESLEIAAQLGVLEFLLEETITCYHGLRGFGCRACPACKLRNEGIEAYTAKKAAWPSWPGC